MKPLLVTALVAGLAMPAAPGAQLKPDDLKKLRETLLTSLDVREGSGDFTGWVREASIETGALVRQFRWKTSLAGVASARYEVVHGTFPAGQGYVKPANLVQSEPVTLPSGPGAYGLFKVDFWPALRMSVGTEAPPSPVTLHVRLVLLDAGSRTLASTPVKITYAPPADGTIFSGSSMVVRLQTVKCVAVTKGLGGDQLDATVIARPRNGAPAQVVYWKNEDMDDGTAFHPSKPLWTFQGLSFEPDVDLIVVLQEDDAGGAFQAGIQPPPNTSAFRDNLVQAACTGDHDCIGAPQTLPVTAADWHKVAVERQTLTRTLTFKGGLFITLGGRSTFSNVGGHYELTFQLAPK